MGAEADPALLYSGLGYAHAAPLAYTTYAAPIAVGKSPLRQRRQRARPLQRRRRRLRLPLRLRPAPFGKREAEAEPALVYSGLHVLHGYGYAGLPYATTYAAPLVHSSHVGLCLNYVGQRVPC